MQNNKMDFNDFSFHLQGSTHFNLMEQKHSAFMINAYKNLMFFAKFLGKNIEPLVDVLFICLVMKCDLMILLHKNDHPKPVIVIPHFGGLSLALQSFEGIFWLKHYWSEVPLEILCNLSILQFYFFLKKNV